MRQRAMIAMAIANDPDILLADEPTTALDVTIQAQVLDVLRTAQRETGAALVLVSHDLGVIAGMADRVAVMYAGRVVETAPVDELFAHPRHPYTLGLIGAVPRLDGARGALVPIPGQPPAPGTLGGGCPFADRCPLVEDRCRTEEPALTGDGDHLAACLRADFLAGTRPAPQEVYPVPPLPEPDLTPREEREQVLAVTGLTKTFPVLKGTVFKRRVGSVHAVDGVELDLRRGETLGLVGESGSGKSTTLFELLGLTTPEAGRIELLGHDTATLTKADAHRLRGEVQIVFQDPMASLDPRQPVGDIIAEPLLAQRAPRELIDRRIPQLLRQVGLDPAHAGRYPHQFSGGQRQRISIARALAVEPKLLVLDEPVSALDVSVQAGVLNLLQQLKAELGLAYLFVSHDLSVIRHLCDRVSVMYLGRTVEEGPVAEVLDHPRHPYTRALRSAVPLPDPAAERARTRTLLPGDPPSPTETPHRLRLPHPLPALRRTPPGEAPGVRADDPAAHRRSRLPPRLTACPSSAAQLPGEPGVADQLRAVRGVQGEELRGGGVLGQRDGAVPGLQLGLDPDRELAQPAAQQQGVPAAERERAAQQQAQRAVEGGDRDAGGQLAADGADRAPAEVVALDHRAGLREGRQGGHSELPVLGQLRETVRELLGGEGEGDGRAGGVGGDRWSGRGPCRATGIQLSAVAEPSRVQCTRVGERPAMAGARRTVTQGLPRSRVRAQVGSGSPPETVRRREEGQCSSSRSCAVGVRPSIAGTGPTTRRGRPGCSSGSSALRRRRGTAVVIGVLLLELWCRQTALRPWRVKTPRAAATCSGVGEGVSASAKSWPRASYLAAPSLWKGSTSTG
ncbi:hypothetical protein GCM10020229_41870 [Kitasatospora albolonga]